MSAGWQPGERLFVYDDSQFAPPETEQGQQQRELLHRLLAAEQFVEPISVAGCRVPGAGRRWRSARQACSRVSWDGGR
jgi:hypothetical protein